MSANAWANSDDMFHYHTKWYNIGVMKFSRSCLLAYHIIGVYIWYANMKFYQQRFEESAIYGGEYISVLIPILQTICLTMILMDRNVTVYGTVLMALNFIHLTIIPLPWHNYPGITTWHHYHIEWALQGVKIMSVLAFIAAKNIKENNEQVIEGTPSFGIYILLKAVPLLIASIFVYRFARTVRVEDADYAELSLLSLISLFWIYAFFHNGYECPVYALLAGLVLGWHNGEMTLDIHSEFAQDVLFLFLPMIVYLYSAGLSSHPFKRYSHGKAD